MERTERTNNIFAAFANQHDYCIANSAPITGRIVQAVANLIDDSSEFGRRILNWEGAPLADALPLRTAAGFHALYRSGTDPNLAPLYGGDITALENAENILAETLARYEDRLLPWLDGPPQTNEVGRSANFIAAMLYLAQKGAPPRFDMFEIGSSAGINLMLGQYHYNLAGIEVGPASSKMRIAPEWRGNPPPKARDFRIIATRGCDISPVNLTDPEQAARLAAYIWPEHEKRFENLQHAIGIAQANPPALEQGVADQWVTRQLERRQDENSTRILVHSIVWQYLGQTAQDEITARMEAAGKRASSERQLAWAAVEANRETLRHELILRHWDGGDNQGEPVKLGYAHAHGAWVEWIA